MSLPAGGFGPRGEGGDGGRGSPLPTGISRRAGEGFGVAGGRLILSGGEVSLTCSCTLGGLSKCFRTSKKRNRNNSIAARVNIPQRRQKSSLTYMNLLIFVRVERVLIGALRNRQPTPLERQERGGSTHAVDRRKCTGSSVAI